MTVPSPSNAEHPTLSAAYSGRRSGRVEPLAVGPTEFPGPGVTSAPESLTPVRVRFSARRRAVRPTQRLSTERVERLEHSLSARDKAILTCLQHYRFLTTDHLQRLHFHNHATPTAAGRVCRRVLERLARLRVIEHLERRIGGVRAGSASYVWRVGLLGDRLLRTEHRDQPRARRKEPSLRNLEHWLAIADAHLVLVELARTGQLDLLQSTTEPGCWRTYLGPAGDRQTLKPDLYAVTAIGEFEDHWFGEIDRGTESLPTILRKCVQYETYRRSGREQHDHGVFPLVVWITTTDQHADQLRDAISASRSLDADHFRVCSLAGYAALVQGGAA
ncbi:MAG: hypothetical protein JWN95_448 [Frankiales bacterium]|nr:hypothetical protein [Frankiales bacterium]